jgi:hypothetical protein
MVAVGDAEEQCLGKEELKKGAAKRRRLPVKT